MSKKECRCSIGNQGEAQQGIAPLVRSSRFAWLRLGRFKALLLGMLLILGTALASCSTSAATVNNAAKAAPTGNPAPPPAATSTATNPGVASGPTSLTQASPKPNQPLSPKQVTPAPTVVAIGNGPRIAFENEEADFGDVQFGDIVKYDFTFKNVGNEPLIITGAQVKAVEGC